MLDGGFWKALVNDPHYAIPLGIMVIVLVCCGAWMAGRFYIVNQKNNSQPQENSEASMLPLVSPETTTLDTVKKPVVKKEVVKKKEQPAQDQRRGNFSDDQKGGTVNQTYVEKLQFNIENLPTRDFTNADKDLVINFMNSFEGEEIIIRYRDGVETNELAQKIYKALSPHYRVVLNKMLLSEHTRGQYEIVRAGNLKRAVINIGPLY